MFLARLESLSCAFLPLQQPTEAVVGGSVGHALRTDTPVDDAHTYVSADARTLRRHVQQGCPSALSQITENRKVEARKSLIFQYPIFGFCLQKATLRQSQHDCQFAWTAHEDEARREGLSAEVIDIIRHRRPVPSR